MTIKMFRTRQRFLWLLGIAVVWFVGVYLVYQKATASSLMATWPMARGSAAAGVAVVSGEQRRSEQLLNGLDKLEETMTKNVATYEALHKKFLYYIRKKFKTKAKEEGEEVAESEVNEGRGNVLPSPDDNGAGGGIRIPVIVFACNRVSVSNCLDNLLKYRPSAHQFPIIVSQVSGGGKWKGNY